MHACKNFAGYGDKTIIIFRDAMYTVAYYNMRSEVAQVIIVANLISPTSANLYYANSVHC